MWHTADGSGLMSKLGMPWGRGGRAREEVERSGHLGGELTFPASHMQTCITGSLGLADLVVLFYPPTILMHSDDRPIEKDSIIRFIERHSEQE